MATHSSILAWRIPGTEEPGGLLSMGSHRVGHDWSHLAAAAGPTTSLKEILELEELAKQHHKGKLGQMIHVFQETNCMGG